MNDAPVYIIGAGPAGLSAAYELIHNGTSPIVLEALDKVGGMARTETFNGYRFDIGGHRFFTQNDNIAHLWREMLGRDLLSVKRLSRIYYQGLFLSYPLSAADALRNLGLKESLLIGLSYLHALLRPIKEEETFEQWVVNRFGRRLYRLFFESYTEKVWGMPCSDIHAAWAAQRIRGLSLATAVTHSFLGPAKAKSLIDRFDYPSLGPGQLWRRLADRVEAGGGRIILNAEVVRLEHRRGHVHTVVYRTEGIERALPAAMVLSSAPITDLVDMLSPGAPEPVRRARRELRHRAFVVVLLILDNPSLFPDQWIYVHHPEVKVGRIQNFKNWSPAMLEDPRKTSIGMEYFCDEGDPLWSMSDEDLLALAARELEQLGLARAAEVREGCVTRQPRAYPVYHRSYEAHLWALRRHIDGFDNLLTMGRGGTHRYNNMDHAMETGFLAARAALGDRSDDVWGVNEEPRYLEATRLRRWRRSR